MKLHPRTQIVSKARCELATFLCELEIRHELTLPEVTSLLADRMAQAAKYMIRYERHPDSDKRGDEA